MKDTKEKDNAMKKTKRTVGALSSVILAAGMIPPVALAPHAYAANQTQLSAGTNYYGNALNTASKLEKYPTAHIFYSALSNMDFVSGTSIDVTDAAVIAQAEAYTNGDNALIENFGAAVDSFKYDHSEVFYVNWDNLTVNVYRNNGAFRVEIGTGRTDSYHLDPTASVDQIKAQVADYNSRLNAIVAEAQSLATGNDSKSVAAAATTAVCNHIDYSFCTDNAEAAKYVQTSYGALVYGKSVCEGYSRLFKQIMDRMGKNTELIYGNYVDSEKFEAHMWNYVQDGDDWYAVDVTGCDDHTVGTGSATGTTTVDKTLAHKYFWRTSDVFFIDHLEGNVISSVLYEMPYPTLRDMWATPTSSGRFVMGEGTYNGQVYPYISFDGMSAKKLRETKGLYMSMSTAITNEGPLYFSPMQSIVEWQKDQGYGPHIIDSADGTKTWICLDSKATAYWTVGIFDIIDDAVYSPLTGSKKYSDDAFTHHLIETTIIENKGYDEKYLKPAYIDYKHSTPSNLFQKRQDITQKLHVEVAYEEPLRVTNGGTDDDAILSWNVSSYNNRNLTLEAVQKNAKLENVKFEGARVYEDGIARGVISFDFTPSRSFNHNMIWYNFKLDNVVNMTKPDANGNVKDGAQAPGFSIVWAYSGSTACSNVFGDGRLWINTYAQPYLVSTTDMSTEGWTFPDGTGISAAQRSQMALVVTYPNDAAMLENAAEELAGNDAVTVSKTYEIDLNICGKHPVIPNGSYMNMNLGIPDEFADLVGNENVVFKLYHFKRNSDGTLDYSQTEEIPCTFTKNGIVAKVTSFSPYVLVALDKDKVENVSKTVVEEFNGKGGSFTVTGDAAIGAGDFVTYTFTPEEGYALEFVKLNGVDHNVVDNKLTLSYTDLGDNNVLTFGFISNDTDTDGLIAPPSVLDADEQTSGDDNGNGNDNGEENGENGGENGDDNGSGSGDENGTGDGNENNDDNGDGDENGIGDENGADDENSGNDNGNVADDNENVPAGNENTGDNVNSVTAAEPASNVNADGSGVADNNAGSADVAGKGVAATGDEGLARAIFAMVGISVIATLGMALKRRKR